MLVGSIHLVCVCTTTCAGSQSGATEHSKGFSLGEICPENKICDSLGAGNRVSPKIQASRLSACADLTRKQQGATMRMGVPLGGMLEQREERGIGVAEQQSLISDFVNRRVWAVVGASQDPSKFGNRIFRNMRDAGYVVYPVNPRGGELEGVKVYPSLADLPQSPEVVDVVVPPPVTEQVVKEAHALGLTRVWLQPGAESDAAIAYCQENGIQVIHGACAMVWKRQWK